MAAKTFLNTALTISAILFLPAHLTFAAPPRYEIIDLGTLGGDRSSASFINVRGQIVGMAYNQQENRRATLFDSTGNGNNIDLGGINSWACSVNYSGQIVGSADNEQNDLRATLFDPTGSGNNIYLGTLGGLRSNALFINNSGQIVGSARNGQGYQRATLFDPTGGGNNIDLGTLGGIHSQAGSINDRGQIVGNARIPRGYSHATLFDPTGGGSNTDLGTLGGSSSNACCINNLGQIVGWAATDWLDNRATLFDPTGGGKNIELGTLGGRLSWAEAINDLGQIVGAAENQLRDTRATLFDPTGTGNNIDLNTLIDPAYGWTLKYTDSINNHGWIVGTGINPAGESRAFLMKPFPRIIYVDDDAAGANDGSSWADAYNFLQDALADANSASMPVEIRVAQGIYTPDSNSANPNGSGDREATFQLINGVTLKGGYAGVGQSDPNARDIELYETILTGDLNGDDGPDFGNIQENSYHVVTGSGTDVTAILGGFTVSGGNADGYSYSDPNSKGAGMYNQSGSPTLANCTFRGNSAAAGWWCIGGGMYSESGSPALTYCTFEQNSAAGGGAMYIGSGNPVLKGCTFVGNTTDHYGGGALAISDYGSPMIINSKFENNYSGGYGGAISSHSYRSPKLTNCIVTGNSSLRSGGGMSIAEGSPILTNCKFSDNSAVDYGGAVHCEETSSLTIRNSLIIGNKTEWNGGGISITDGSQAIIENCTISDNSANNKGGGIYSPDRTTVSNSILRGSSPDQIYDPYGGYVNHSDVEGGWLGEGNIDADPCFVERGYWDVNSLWIDGDYHLLPDSPCIDAGDPNYVAEPNETDLDGKPRVIGDRIDMGAYEYDSTAIQAEVDIDPNTLNLNSKGRWITAFIWLPEEYNVADIDPNSIFLENEIEPERFWLTEDQQIAIAKFNREEVRNILSVGEIELTITAQLTDGTVFEGTDTIKVIDKAGKK